MLPIRIFIFLNINIWINKLIYTFRIDNRSQIVSLLSTASRFTATVPPTGSRSWTASGNNSTVLAKSSFFNKHMLCNTQHAIITFGIRSTRSIASVVRRLRKRPLSNPNDLSIASHSWWRMTKIIIFLFFNEMSVVSVRYQ